MRHLRIGEAVVLADAEDLPARLADAYAVHGRPLCLCRADGIAMYVARMGSRHILKRMPGTGPSHDSGCGSYEAPYELSGLGQLASGAIQENVEEGVTVLKLDVSLSKTARKTAAAAQAEANSGEVRNGGAKLSLRALLHYLWAEAEFNRWRPGMAGKRHWGVIRKFLLEAAEGKTTKGKPLIDILFVPEPFSLEREAEIDGRRAEFLARIAKGDARRRQLALLIGEVKDLAPSSFGHRMIIKHLPKFPFMLSEDGHKRLTKVFANDLALWDAMPDTHLIAIATFGLGPTGLASIEAIALMVVTGNWIPFEHVHDAALIDALTKRNASFLKGLRYNMPASNPLASVVLQTDRTAPLAMYVVQPGASADFRGSLDALIAESHLAAWVWDAETGRMPPLPP